MKRILAFIGLKVLEISAIIFIPYFIGFGISRLEWLYPYIDPTLPLWIIGLFCIAIMMVAIMVCAGCFLAIQANWNFIKKHIK